MYASLLSSLLYSHRLQLFIVSFSVLYVSPCVAASAPLQTAVVHLATGQVVTIDT